MIIGRGATNAEDCFVSAVLSSACEVVQPLGTDTHCLGARERRRSGSLSVGP